LNDRTQAVIYALRRGWIDTPVDAITNTPLRIPALEDEKE
jgi:hypothetical protein